MADLGTYLTAFLIAGGCAAGLAWARLNSGTARDRAALRELARRVFAAGSWSDVSLRGIMGPLGSTRLAGLRRGIRFELRLHLLKDHNYLEAFLECPCAWEFHAARAGPITRAAVKAGLLEDAEIGVDWLDAAFQIKASDPQALRELFRGSEVLEPIAGLVKDSCLVSFTASGDGPRWGLEPALGRIHPGLSCLRLSRSRGALLDPGEVGRTLDALADLRRALADR